MTFPFGGGLNGDGFFPDDEWDGDEAALDELDDMDGVDLDYWDEDEDEDEDDDDEDT